MTNTKNENTVTTVIPPEPFIPVPVELAKAFEETLMVAFGRTQYASAVRNDPERTVREAREAEERANVSRVKMWKDFFEMFPNLR